MGKITIIVESGGTSTKTLEQDAHRYFDELRGSDAIPEDAEVFIVPSDND